MNWCSLLLYHIRVCTGSFIVSSIRVNDIPLEWYVPLRWLRGGGMGDEGIAKTYHMDFGKGNPKLLIPFSAFLVINVNHAACP